MLIKPRLVFLFSFPIENEKQNKMKKEMGSLCSFKNGSMELTAS